MSQKTYSLVTGILLCAVAALHIIRATTGLEVTVANWLVPVSVNWVAALIAGILGIIGISIGRK